jgi:thioredoxin reductase
MPALDGALISRSRGGNAMTSHKSDVAIVGGGAAGLSAALVLARDRRRVVVLDAGSPRNAPAAHMHNFLSRDGMPPAELLAAGRAEVVGYGGQIVSATVVGVESTSTGFDVALDRGGSVVARRLLIATGLTDRLPEVPGLRERWGRDVLHCPYCHGYEVRDQPLAVLASGPRSVQQALLVRQLSPDVVFFRHTLAELSAEDTARLAARGIQVVDGTVTRLVTEGDRLSGVQLADGTVLPRSAVFVMPHFVANQDIVAALGVETESTAVGTWIKTDPGGRTTAPGVWAVGNVADIAAFVIESAAAGARAGAAINADLVDEDVELAMYEHTRVTAGTAR